MLRWIKANPLSTPRDNMARRNQLAQQLDQASVIENTTDIQMVKENTVENSDISAKCDAIIAKIKIKKVKKTKNE